MPTQRLPHSFIVNESQHRRRFNELSDQVSETIGSIATGTGDVGALQSQLNTTTNSNGSYTQANDGTIDSWGVSAAVPTGASTATVAVTFPKAFIAAPVVVCGPDNQPDATGNFPFCCYPSSITTTGFTANLSCAVLIGGAGATGILNIVHVEWMAKGK